MFTGIIQEKGEIIDIKKAKKAIAFSVKTNSILKNKKIGESIAVDGVCVTITNIDKKTFSFDIMPETYSITIFDNYKKGSIVNLEPAAILNQALDGHLVQGHVDATGEIHSLTKEKERVQLKLFYPKEISKFLAFKGPITINGVNLTISDLQKDTFTVDLIPHTLKITNLNGLNKGDKVNIEVDLIAKYLNNLLDSKEQETKYEYLKERGFI